jgi:hypothetical protein
LLAWCNSGCTATFKRKGKRTKGFTVRGTIAEKKSRLMFFYTNYNANKAHFAAALTSGMPPWPTFFENHVYLRKPPRVEKCVV